jgi:hypothetical protein
VARTAHPFERKEEHCEGTAHRDKPTAVIVGHQSDIEENQKRIHKGLCVPQPFLLEFGDDATTGQKVMNPDHDADSE